MNPTQEQRSWIWLQRDAGISYIGQATKAYDLIIDTFIPTVRQAGIPHEFIYCPVSDTTNFTIESKFLDVAWGIIFKDAGFIEKQVPLKDQMASAELKEAIIRGSDFSKHWH